MFLLLLFSFMATGTFEWEEVERIGAKAITRQIKESYVVKSYGEDVLKKSFIYFNDDIFEPGNKLVIPERAEILRFPAGLKISKTEIDIIKHDRYAVTYEEGKLKDEWMKLKRESEKLMGVSSFKNLTGEQIGQIMSRIHSRNQVRRRSGSASRVEKEYPEKIYISFILIEENRQIKLLPVVLAISPIQTLLDNMEGI